ncbi:putative transposase [Neolewinella xylanilytica]|uniref:Putative transposase n=1 Tax=Neolewinella xylanilytica TaxID=1514080 RepID=A0A2S6I495_9BACT|nr:hypothetical protein [Neolewinella xylanilytica]PPK85994.1 putative transposase [Neolewinella xylanilytica]
MYHESVIYHVYNQSINYELLFREHGNYHFFLNKLRRHIMPLADILCYCLMPDHFHLMLKPKAAGCAPSRCGRFLRADEDDTEVKFQQELSHAFKIALSSYAKAINRQYRRRGSLFRAKTKAKPAYHAFYPEAASISELESFTRFIPYLQTCFHYIHDNPTKAKLATDPLDWEFSSDLDYAGWRDSNLCNFDVTERLLGIERTPDKTGPGGSPSGKYASGRLPQ